MPRPPRRSRVTSRVVGANHVESLQEVAANTVKFVFSFTQTSLPEFVRKLPDSGYMNRVSSRPITLCSRRTTITTPVRMIFAPAAALLSKSLVHNNLVNYPGFRHLCALRHDLWT